MKKRFALLLVLILTISYGCQTSKQIQDITSTSAPYLTSVTVNSSPTLTPSPAVFTTPKPTSFPTFPPETRLHSQCLNVESMPINKVDSDGVLVLENRASLDEGHYKPGTFLLDMKSGQKTEITIADEDQIEHVVSPNRRLVAYQHVTYNSSGEVARTELVVANAKGQPISVMPWEKGWVAMPAWLDNEHLVINVSGLNPEENAGDKPATLLVLDPFSGERKILKPDFPKILNIHSTLSAILPFWDGWSGAIYDPALTRAIYPRFIDNNEDMFTYAIWDPSKPRLIATLENVFATHLLNTAFPMPKWSPDGSQFVFQGVVDGADPMKFELYEVSRDGQTKPLTNLSSVAYVWESTYSWSPDGRYIAMFLSPPIGVVSENALVAVLDTATLDVTDYCVNTAFSGKGYGSSSPIWSPIWSPDSRQFVVTDWYEKEHRHVILIDIEKNIATQIAEDVEPVGWMAMP